MERSGSGLRKIYNVYKESGFREPELDDQHDYFLITLYDLLGEERAVVTISKYDDEILSFCKEQARSREEIQNHIGIKSRSYFTIRILKPMLESGFLEPTSDKKSKTVKYITSNGKRMPEKEM